MGNLTLASFAQAKPYTPKNGILNWKAVLLGGAFRVTTAIPPTATFPVRSTRGRPRRERHRPTFRHAAEKLTGLAEEFRKGER